MEGETGYQAFNQDFRRNYENRTGYVFLGVAGALFTVALLKSSVLPLLRATNDV